MASDVPRITPEEMKQLTKAKVSAKPMPRPRPQPLPKDSSTLLTCAGKYRFSYPADNTLDNARMQHWQEKQLEHMSKHKSIMKAKQEIEKFGKEVADPSEMGRLVAAMEDILPTPIEAQGSNHLAEYRTYVQDNTGRVSFMPHRYVTYVKGRPYVQCIMSHPKSPVYEWGTFQSEDLRPLTALFLQGVTGRDEDNKIKSPQFAAGHWVKVTDVS